MTGKSPCGCHEASFERLSQGFAFHSAQLAILILVSTALDAGRPAIAASPPGDVVGKVSVGYQGWFASTSDGSPINAWWHWSPNSQTPSSTNIGIYSWPDMRQYARGFQTAFANLSNGQPATLFSSYDQQVVDTHFRWMQENEIDTAALQRFSPFGGEGPTRNGMTLKVRSAAETYQRKFYIMYDISGWDSFATQLKTDWTNYMLAQINITNSPAYAMQNGKPVVCIWGMGFTDRPGDAATCTEVINWFKAQGCYVIGGVPTWWRDSISDSKTNFLSVYTNFHMISPWMVGRFNDAAGSDWYRSNVNQGDITYCNSHGIDYQPCIVPGHSGQTPPTGRLHGDFMWHQVVNMMQIGAQGLYISMYDEFNEATQIIPTAEDASMNPAGSSFITWDADGVHCSADFYLRLTGDAGRMFKGQIPFQTTHSTPFVLPPVVPPTPTNLTAEPGNTQVRLTWAASVQATSYTIRRANASGGPYTTVATNIGLLSYTDTGLSNDTAYYYVVQAVNPTGQSPDSAEISATPILVGLKGDYYDNRDFTGFVLSRVDPGVNFDWGNGSPNPSIGVDTFSVRWTGQLVPLFSETYTFFTLSDDGVRLWVNGVQLVSNWTDHPPTENSGVIALTAGVRYSIQMDYYENGGGATAALSWSSSSQTKEIIPANRLFPPVSVTPPQLGFTISGNAMRFTWPADHVGWRLVAQTNAVGAGLGTNWTTVPDSAVTNQIFVPINPANGSAFFRLVYP